MPSLKLEKSFGPLQLVCQLSSRVRIFSAKTVSKGEQATSDQCDDHGQIRGRDHTTLSKLKCALESQRDGGPIVCSRKSAKKILILIGKHAQCPAGVSKPIVKACEALEHALWKAWEQMNSDLIMAARIEVQTEILDLCPVGHADRATSCQSLASSLKILYDYTEDLQLLEKAIQLRREVLERNLLTPSGHPMPYASAHLAVCLKEHFVQSKDIAKLEEAVMLFREALRLCSSGHSDRVLCSGNLAAALQTWSKHTGEDESLNAAIELYGEALDLCPSKNPHRARLCRELAIALGTRFEQTGDTTLLDKAISLGQEAMKLCPPGHPNRAKSCQEFGDLLTIRFDTAEDIGCFDAALGVYREVLDIYPPGHRLRADACASLAMLLRTRYIQIGQKALLDEAIKFGREAFDLSSPGDPNRAWFCGQHVTSLTVLFRHTQEVEVLDEAINLSRKELAFHSEGNLVREMLCNNLATSLVARFNHMGGIASLDNAIGMLRAELAARSPTHLSRAHLYTNLAIALRERFEQTGESTLLQEIIQLDREALDLRPFGHCNRALSCDSLAESLARYFEDTGDVASLNEALHHYKEALALRPPGHSERASSCNSLAVLLMTYYEASSDNTLLARAIEMYEAAYDLHSPGSPNRAHSCRSLAEALLIRLPTLEGEGDRHATMDRVQLLLEQAREPYPVGHPLRWRHFHTLAMRAIYTHDWPTVINQMREIMDCTVYDNIHLVLHSASTYLQQVDLDALSSAQKHALLVLCGQAIGRMHLAVMLPINASTQLKRVHVAQSLGYRAFMLAVAIGEVSTGVQLLEHARGVVWSQMLHRREPKLDKIPDEFAHMLRTLLHSDRGLQLSEGAHTRDHQYAQRGQIQEVVRKIRLLPGMDSFMQGPSTEALMSVVDFSTVIMLVATDSACYAVVMASSGKPSVHVLLLDLNAKMLSDLSFAGGSSFHRGCTMEEDDAERGMRVSKGMSPSHTRLAKLWRAVVKPVISHLQLSKATGRARPRIHWCPTGPFAFIPIHAAGIYQGPYQECCSDYAVSSYTPTLTALLRAHESQQSFTSSQVKLLGVAAERAQDPSMPRLRRVEEEVREAIDVVTRAGVSATFDLGTMPKAHLLTSLRSANIVHLACHGVQHVTDPHKSRFCLSTGDLTALELAEMDLKDPFFAFLSACDTAKGDQKHADEVVHLAATMLFVGFKSVVATMWAMSDADGPFIAKCFYERLFEHGTIDIASIPYALDHAVGTLRKSGVSPERWATFVHMGA